MKSSMTRENGVEAKPFWLIGISVNIRVNLGNRQLNEHDRYAYYIV